MFEQLVFIVIVFKSLSFISVEEQEFEQLSQEIAELRQENARWTVYSLVSYFLYFRLLNERKLQEQSQLMLKTLKKKMSSLEANLSLAKVIILYQELVIGKYR